ncbi:hypothetical protein [Ruminococcus albus]|uniref:Uncharacterized protein n=1 Tax=Ruminococcus albus TaxID=1264 RepID=A0A1H7HY34_RUMAL|nr:hypothetical protein [Ruminococcus albus]SEK55068.1 hypothetical protein SAMN05216469_103145 [Ruminococcus albus]
MEKRGKFEIKQLIAVLAAGLIFFSPMLIGYIYDRRHPVTTLTGHDALVQIHGYLGCTLLQLLAMPFASALSGFVGSVIYRAGEEEYKGKRIWSPVAVVILTVLGTVTMLFIPKVSGLDLQQELKGYNGMSVMRIAQLYNACGEDMESGAVRKIEIDNAETDYEIFTYRKASGSKGGHKMGYSSQYSLNGDGETVAQISKSDSRRMELLFLTRSRHSVEIYENSGFIASFDGYDTLPSDFSDMFTLERDGDYIRMNVLENEKLADNIVLVLERDGEERRTPAGRSEYYFPETMKGYSCRIALYRGGEYLTLSNTVYI